VVYFRKEEVKKNINIKTGPWADFRVGPIKLNLGHFLLQLRYFNLDSHKFFVFYNIQSHFKLQN